MLTPSLTIIQLLATFAPAFTKPTFQKVLVLIYGTILAPGKRTVTAKRLTGTISYSIQHIGTTVGVSSCSAHSLGGGGSGGSSLTVSRFPFASS